MENGIKATDMRELLHDTPKTWRHFFFFFFLTARERDGGFVFSNYLTSPQLFDAGENQKCKNKRKPNKRTPPPSFPKSFHLVFFFR